MQSKRPWCSRKGRCSENKGFWVTEVQTHGAVVHRVASPTHDVQHVEGPVHLAVDAVQDRVVCGKRPHKRFLVCGHQDWLGGGFEVETGIKGAISKLKSL